MARLDRYLLSQLLVMFGFFSLVLVAVYWVNRAVSLFDRLIGDGQSAMVFLEFSALTLPNVIRVVLPVSAFAGTVYVTNRLNTESELVVMQATGFSPFRLARPVLIFGLFVAVLLSVLTHVLVPASRSVMSARTAEISQNVAARFLTEGVFLHPADGITLYIREISPQGELRDVFLSDRRDVDAAVTYTAERAFLAKADTGPKLVMVEGMAQMLEGEGQRLSTTRFADFTYDIADMIVAPGPGQRTVDEFSTAELLNPTPKTLAEGRTNEATFLYEGHARIVHPLLAVIASLLGFAVMLQGGYSRFGAWKQIIGAITGLILLQLLSNAGANLAIKDAARWPATYLPIVVGALAILILLWNAGRPVRRKAGASVAVPA